MVGIVVGDLKLLMYIEYYLFTVHYVHRVLPPKVKIDRQADRFNVFSGTQKITKKRILNFGTSEICRQICQKIDRSADRQIDRFDFLGHSNRKIPRCKPNLCTQIVGTSRTEDDSGTFFPAGLTALEI